MKLHLNLATAPLENRRPFLAGAALIGVLGVIALGLLSHFAYQAWRANRDIRLAISRSQNEIAAERRQQIALEEYFRQPQVQKVLDRANFLNSLIDQRSFPWTKIFMDLEQTLPPGVRVVSISPKLENGRASVSLTIGAATDESKIKFLEALEKSRAFSDVQVKEEHHADQDGAPDKVTLQLTVWYQTT